MATYITKSVLRGWQTFNAATNEPIGPAFNKTADCWDWQRDNLIKTRILIGASAYCNIQRGSRSINVLLSPGRSARVSLLETAKEMQDKAARLIATAEFITAAAATI